MTLLCAEFHGVSRGLWCGTWCVEGRTQRDHPLAKRARQVCDEQRVAATAVMERHQQQLQGYLAALRAHSKARIDDVRAVLCCAVLCCAVLCCAVLCCAVLCCAVLCCVSHFCCRFLSSFHSLSCRPTSLVLYCGVVVAHPSCSVSTVQDVVKMGAARHRERVTRP